jgi:hypothetical protein
VWVKRIRLQRVALFRRKVPSANVYGDYIGITNLGPP